MTKIALWSEQRRKRFVRRGLRTGDAQTARRYLIIALLREGLAPAEVARRALCAESTVGAVGLRFEDEGEFGLWDHRRRNGGLKADERFHQQVKRLLRRRPPDFDWERPTWTRELICLEMQQQGFPGKPSIRRSLDYAA